MSITNEILEFALASTAPLLALKGALLVATALLCERGLRSRSAALRHGVWTAVFVALLILPAIATVVPAWHVPLLPASTTVTASPRGAGQDAGVLTSPSLEHRGAVGREEIGDEEAGARAPVSGRPGDPIATDASTASAGTIGWLPALGAAWVGGVVILLSRLGLSMGVASFICRRARTVDEPQWRRAAEAAARRVGFSGNLRLARTDRVNMPMTWGIRRHTVLLPASAESWSAERREVVLLHEIAHAARADCIAQLISGAAAALHWFNPLVWIARQRHTAARELACDDAVLQAGASPADYARHLLEIARAANGTTRLAPAGVMMARRSQLEGRLLAALEPHRDRRHLTTTASLGVLVAVLLVTVPLGTVSPWAASSADASPQVLATAVVQSPTSGIATQTPGSSETETAPMEPTSPQPEPEPEPAAAAESTTAGQQSGGRARVVATMIGILAGDDSPGMRAEAAQTLGQMEDAAAVEGLARALTEDESASVRSKAAWALGMIESPDAVPALSRALADERTSVRSQAAWALGMIESADAVSALVAALADESADVVSQAAWALGMIESADAVEGLTGTLRTHDAQAVRSQAAWALGMIEDERGLEALIDALEDDHDSVRQQALWAIGMIVG